MNIFIVIGVILTAIGTLVLTYGGVIQSRKDAEKNEKVAAEQYHEISKDLAELKGKPKAELSYGVVQKIEDDVKKWAQLFLSEKDKLKDIHNIKKEKETLRLESVQQLSKEYFVFLMQILSKAIDSYNKELSLNISEKLPEIDSNLFASKDTKFDGVVTFPSGAEWKIRAYLSEPGPAISGPIILIDKISHSGSTEKTEFQLRFGKNIENFHIRLLGDFLLAYGSGRTNGSISEYEERIKIIIRNLLETEIISLK